LAVGSSAPAFFVIPPTTDVLSNATEGQITYQFAPNAMIGASGSFFDLNYLDLSQVPGLFDSSQREAQVFYTHRLSGKYYIGGTYDFEDIQASPINTETQVHSATFFYTVKFGPKISLSTSGGVQYSDIFGNNLVPEQMWSPTGSGTLTWQGLHTSFTADISRRITPGGGLGAAAHSYTVDTSIRHQFTPAVTVSLSGSYIDNNVLQRSVLFSSGGHAVSGSGTLQRTLGKHLSAEIGYTRIHEDYSDIAAIQGSPDRNRAWASISYRFERPLGR
jgi:hypothetical protein